MRESSARCLDLALPQGQYIPFETAIETDASGQEHAFISSAWAWVQDPDGTRELWAYSQARGAYRIENCPAPSRRRLSLWAEQHARPLGLALSASLLLLTFWHA